MNDDDDDDDGGRRAPMHWGDMGALVLAGGFSLFGLYLIADMAMGGHPLAVLFGTAKPDAPRKLTQAEWDQKTFTTQPGEIILSTSTAVRPGSTFPKIAEWKTLRITLERDVCLGSCPSYTVEIAGDGSVVYQGRACVAQAGERHAQIPVADVKDLVAKFRDVDVFTLRGEYRAQVTDHPTFTTTIAFDGRKKSVVDHVGASAGMPHKVTALEDAIDAAAGTGRWVGKGACGGKP
ncbi:MAG: hypothetical protein JOZ72_00025 [Alphaproteobacteria bacterium]|nr:hypothetical protein [Alphaproteobacteria bacterium]